jgi:hypothetical protein
MMKEYQGFQDMKALALAVVRLLKGERIHGTLTRWEYHFTRRRTSKVKYKVCMMIRKDQQVEGKSLLPLTSTPPY